MPSKKKDTLKDHPVIWCLGAISAAFGLGWGAYYAVQKSSNLVPVSVEKARLLENIDEVIRERDQLLEQQARLLKEDGARARIVQLESEVKDLQKQLLKNRPLGPAYISNIKLAPTSPAVLKVREKIWVEFDFVVPKGQAAFVSFHPSGVQVYSRDEGSPGYSYEANNPVSGSGSAKRWFSINTPTKLIEVKIQIDSAENDEKVLYEMVLPVSYLFRK